MSEAKETFVEMMWGGFILWAAGEQKILAEFTKATGIKVPTSPRSALEAMIDKATGYQEGFAESFIRYVTEQYWGIKEAPKSYQEYLKKVKK